VRFDAGHFRYARDYTRTLGVEIEGDDGFAMARPGDIFVGLDWAFEQMPAMRARLADWRRGGMRSCFVVYDLLPITLPDHFHPHARERFLQWLEGVVHLSDHLACISRTTADALSKWLSETSGRDQFGRRAPLTAFPLGSDANARVEAASALRPALRQALAARQTLLMVGTLEPRKGHADALDLCDALWQHGVDVNLVFAGRRGWMTEMLVARLRAHPERDRRLFWYEDVGDAELAALYAGATALLALSHGEGYGLPLVEAAQHGLPVFARDLPVFHEILGDYPHYLTGSAGSWSSALARWLGSPTRKVPPRLPTWADSARALADIVRSALDD
jgi:glycosyltransferase involved in cell wall biosynthesis